MLFDFAETLDAFSVGGIPYTSMSQGNYVAFYKVGDTAVPSKSATLSLVGIRNYMGAYSSSLTFGITVFTTDQQVDILYAGTKTISYQTYVNLLPLTRLTFSPTTV